MRVWSAHMYAYLYVCQGAGQRVNVFLISLHFIYSDRVSHLNLEFADWTIPLHPREPLSLPRLQVSHHTCLAFRRVLGIQTLVLTWDSHTFSLSHTSSPCGLGFKSIAHFIIGLAPYSLLSVQDTDEGTQTHRLSCWSCLQEWPSQAVACYILAQDACTVVFLRSSMTLGFCHLALSWISHFVNLTFLFLGMYIPPSGVLSLTVT